MHLRLLLLALGLVLVGTAAADVIGPPSVNISLHACIEFDGASPTAAGSKALETLMSAVPPDVPLYSAIVSVKSKSVEEMSRDLTHTISLLPAVRNARLDLRDLHVMQTYREGHQSPEMWACPIGQPKVMLFFPRKLVKPEICGRHWGCSVNCSGASCAVVN